MRALATGFVQHTANILPRAVAARSFFGPPPSLKAMKAMQKAEAKRKKEYRENIEAVTKPLFESIKKLPEVGFLHRGDGQERNSEAGVKKVAAEGYCLSLAHNIYMLMTASATEIAEHMEAKKHSEFGYFDAKEVVERNNAISPPYTKQHKKLDRLNTLREQMFAGKTLSEEELKEAEALPGYEKIRKQHEMAIAVRTFVEELGTQAMLGAIWTLAGGDMSNTAENSITLQNELPIPALKDLRDAARVIRRYHPLNLNRDTNFFSPSLNAHDIDPDSPKGL